MLVELTPDESRYLLGLLSEHLAELRAEIEHTGEGLCLGELKRDQIRVERIIHRLGSAREPDKEHSATA